MNRKCVIAEGGFWWFDITANIVTYKLKEKKKNGAKLKKKKKTGAKLWGKKWRKLNKLFSPKLNSFGEFILQ